MSHGSVAKKVRENKENHPERYCSTTNCLWRLSSGPCPSHGKEKKDGIHA